MPHLYKYMPASTAKIVLGNRTLRWSTPPTLNDPFDMQFAFQVRANRAAVKARALELRWEHHYGALLDRPLNQLGLVIRQTRDLFPRFSRGQFAAEIGPSIDESFDVMVANRDRHNAEIVGQFEDCKILCLADRPDNVLMWSYYAANHGGIVLRFTTETRDNPFAVARQVIYVPQMPSLYTDDELAYTFAGYGRLDPLEIMNAIVWTKSMHWAHEGEWRICAGAGRGPGAFEDVPFHQNELDGVIFGARTSDADRAEIALLSQAYPRIDLLKAVVLPDAYALDIIVA